MSAITAFNKRVPYPIRLLLVAVAGLLLYGSGESALAVIGKLGGGAQTVPGIVPSCSASIFYG